MLRNEIIKQIYDDKQYINYCKQVCVGGDLYNDLFQYVVLYLMEMPKGKLESLYDSGGLRMYVARIIYINAKSERSEFKKQYIDKIVYNEMYDVEGEDNEHLLIKVSKEVEKEINECTAKGRYPASAKLLEIYAECGSYQEVANRTKLKYKTVRRLISELREKIITNIK